MCATTTYDRTCTNDRERDNVGTSGKWEYEGISVQTERFEIVLSHLYCRKSLAFADLQYTVDSMKVRLDCLLYKHCF